LISQDPLQSTPLSTVECEDSLCPNTSILEIHGATQRSNSPIPENPNYASEINSMPITHNSNMKEYLDKNTCQSPDEVEAMSTIQSTHIPPYSINNIHLAPLTEELSLKEHSDAKQHITSISENTFNHQSSQLGRFLMAAVGLISLAIGLIAAIGFTLLSDVSLNGVRPEHGILLNASLITITFSYIHPSLKTKHLVYQVYPFTFPIGFPITPPSTVIIITDNPIPLPSSSLFPLFKLLYDNFESTSSIPMFEKGLSKLISVEDTYCCINNSLGSWPNLEARYDGHNPLPVIPISTIQQDVHLAGQLFKSSPLIYPHLQDHEYISRPTSVSSFEDTSFFSGYNGSSLDYSPELTSLSSILLHLKDTTLQLPAVPCNTRSLVNKECITSSISSNNTRSSPLFLLDVPPVHIPHSIQAFNVTIPDSITSLADDTPVAKLLMSDCTVLKGTYDSEELDCTEHGEHHMAIIST
jgi:hypothetical protein